MADSFIELCIFSKLILIEQTLALVYTQFLSLRSTDILGHISLSCGGVSCAL